MKGSLTGMLGMAVQKNRQGTEAARAEAGPKAVAGAAWEPELWAGAAWELRSLGDTRVRAGAHPSGDAVLLEDLRLR